MPLPISREVHRGLAPHGELGDALDLFAIGDAAAIFAPRGLLGIAQKVGAADVVVMANLSAAKA